MEELLSHVRKRQREGSLSAWHCRVVRCHCIYPLSEKIEADLFPFETVQISLNTAQYFAGLCKSMKGVSYPKTERLGLSRNLN